MKEKGFTLVELMLVVAILGILGALVLPVYQGHASEAKVSSAKSNLHAIRVQIELYKMEHAGALPGFINEELKTADTMITQLTGVSSSSGMAYASKTPVGSLIYGPYLLSMPENPFNNESGIEFTTDFATSVGVASKGWLYNYDTGEIALNTTGTDDDGVAYIDY